MLGPESLAYSSSYSNSLLNVYKRQRRRTGIQAILDMSGANYLGIIRSCAYEVTGRVRSVIGHNAPESSLQAAPFRQQLGSAPTARFFVMPLNDSTQCFNFAWIVDTLELYQF